jgi:ATP-dependent DNA helicase RecG
MSNASAKELELQYLKGIGPRRAELLHHYNIKNVKDLINFFPKRYADRSNIVPIDKLRPEMEVTVIGKIEAAGIRTLRRKIFYIVVNDDNAAIEALWFNSAAYFKKIFKVGQYISLSGKVTFYRGYQIVHPDYDILDESDYSGLVHSGKIISFYSESEKLKKAGISSSFFRKVFSGNQAKLFANLPEMLPASLNHKYNFAVRNNAYQEMHLPQSEESLRQAIFRFKYEDFFFLQLMLASERKHLKRETGGIQFLKKSKRLEKLYQSLPFDLTAAQKKVMKEIRADMKSDQSMNRLIQGDVGSGKTLVALMAMLIAVDNGFQAALMAPTEILAEQHFLNIQKLLAGLDVSVSLLTGNTKTKARKVLNEALSLKQPHIVVGTHALVQNSVTFTNLGLSIVDEQHRFGVMQRGVLKNKGLNADVLVMTATPIPRTLAMTLYGSLDVSVIDELPAGRKKIDTFWRFDDKEQRIYSFITDKIREGRQAYIVYPLIEESDKLDLKDAIDGFERLSSNEFRRFKCGLLHGRMKQTEKEDVMRKFAGNQIQILISTTVIEVGVDVPNAVIMLIEHAERFGLAQLHQLRGRVGRGEKKSYCILKTPYNISEIAAKRMKIMTESGDGFFIAEEDLKLRGWGDFYGVKQSGLPEFRIANPVQDNQILAKARKDAFDLIENDPHLRLAEHHRLRAYFDKYLAKKVVLGKIS